MRAIILLLLLAFVAGCAGPDTEETRMKFVRTLNARLNMPEETLVRSMGRGPDSNYQLNPTTRLLQWKTQMLYTTPGSSPDYIAVGTTIVPVGGRPPQQYVAYCTIEWTVIDGVAHGFKYFGDGCP